MAWGALRVEFLGAYLNLGRFLEPCLCALHQMGELADVQVEEEAFEGQAATYRYELEGAVPVVVCALPEAETERRALLGTS